MSNGLRLSNAQLKAVVYAAESGIHGTGLFASCNIAKGAYIGTYAGPDARRDGTYVLWVYESNRDPQPVGRSGRNLLRYLNHAPTCNAEFDGFDLYAKRAIRRDDEITIDYEGVQ
jgi:SET domain-containing protein